jgi:hypothetical protein
MLAISVFRILFVPEIVLLLFLLFFVFFIFALLERFVVEVVRGYGSLFLPLILQDAFGRLSIQLL